jgi:hypothetical protein
MLHGCHSPSEGQAGVVGGGTAGVLDVAGAESPRGGAADGNALATGAALAVLESVRAGDSR